MSEPVRWTEREVELKPERVERTATYEEILKDFDGPCLVRSLVERCQALEAQVHARGRWEAEHTALKQEIACLRTPRKIVVTLDGVEVAAVVVGAEPEGGHVHRWWEFDGSFYCYGCRAFMPDRAALGAFDPTQALP